VNEPLNTIQRQPKGNDLLLDSLVTRIRAARPDVVAVYLFGSFGTPQARPDSDIDLAILATHPLAAAECWKLAQELAVLARKDVDLLDLLSVSTVMRFQVVGRGRRVFCVNDGACATFETWTYSSYARLNEERREILDDIRRRGRVHA
jgi:predicted nucleotidyltransferase